MTDHSWNLQQAIYALLTANSPTIAGGRVYDDVPQNATFPFVEIGDVLAVPEDATTDDAGLSEFLDLHIWSRYRGKREAQQIWALVRDVLHGASLSVTGRASSLAWVRNWRLILDPDGVTRHGIVTVEIIGRS